MCARASEWDRDSVCVCQKERHGATLTEHGASGCRKTTPRRLPGSPRRGLMPSRSQSRSPGELPVPHFPALHSPCISLHLCASIPAQPSATQASSHEQDVRAYSACMLTPGEERRIVTDAPNSLETLMKLAAAELNPLDLKGRSCFYSSSSSLWQTAGELELV